MQMTLTYATSSSSSGQSPKKKSGSGSGCSSGKEENTIISLRGTNSYQPLEGKPSIKSPLSLVEFAFDSHTKAEVILKHVFEARNASREISALNDLRGIPNISKLLNSYPNLNNQETVFVLPLYKPFNSKKLDLLQIARYFKQLMLILNDIHGENYAHLDISPKNLMVDPSTHDLVLIDFGLARPSESDCEIGCGTPGFISPEVYLGNPACSSMDMYSAGVILGQLLEPYVPGISLYYLGSPLARYPTTNFICRKIQEIQSGEGDADVSWAPIIKDAANLLSKLLEFNPSSRLTASEALRHPFLTSDAKSFEGFDYEAHSRKLLLRPLSNGARKTSREPLILYRDR